MDRIPAGTTSASSASPSARVLSVPNAISGLRLASVPLFVWLFVTGRENAAVILYGVGAASDFLDGYIARRTGAITELGKLLDPLADRVLIVALAIALVAREVLPTWLAVAVIARDVLVLGLWALLERGRARRLPVNLAGKAATALLLVGLTALALSQTTLAGGDRLRAPGTVVAVLGALLYWVAAALYARAATLRLGPAQAPP